VVSIQSISPGSEITLAKAFTFQLKEPLQDLTPVDFAIRAEASSDNWTKSVSVNVSAPDVLLLKPELFDGLDGYLDPGETADLKISLQNIG